MVEYEIFIITEYISLLQPKPPVNPRKQTLKKCTSRAKDS